MRLAEIGIVTGGALTLAVSIGHTFFYRLFRWGEDFGRIGARNRMVLYSIHVALYLLLLPFALVSIAYPAELARPGGLGGTLTLSIAAFWVWRLVWQIVYFGPRAGNEGPGWRRFHRALVLFIAALVAAYGGPAVAVRLAAPGS